jgi:membrane-associated protease RseP (regulator of RpoE activity)
VIGVELEERTRNQPSGFLNSFVRAGGMLGSLTKATGIEIGQIFSLHGLSSIGHDLAGNTGSGAGSAPSARPVSIVGVVEITSQEAANHDIGDALFILAAVNVFVGMINLFPMLPLDGGHVVIAVYERIRSRKGRRYYADVQKMMPVAYLLLAFIIVFGLAALYLDLVNPVHLGG